MSLEGIRFALAANLGTIIPEVQVSPYVLSEPTPPTIQVVLPGAITYDLAMRRGGDQIFATVQAVVSFTSDIGSQVFLDALLAPSGVSSVKTALEADDTLGGHAEDLHVTGATGPVQATVGSGPVLLAEWAVTIWATT